MITKEATKAAPAPAPAVPEPPRPAKRRRAWDEAPRWQIYLPLGVYLVFTLIPFYWILLFALRPAYSTSLVPWPMTTAHFEKVWTDRGFGTFFQNSVLVGVATLFMTTLVALPAATRSPGSTSGSSAGSCWRCSARSSCPARCCWSRCSRSSPSCG